MSILKTPPKRMKNATIQVQVHENIKLHLDSYSRFIGANRAYVVSEALRLLFKKDDEFKRWLSEQNPDDHQKTQGEPITETR